jgi:6-methylsalicylate decarboxylase
MTPHLSRREFLAGIGAAGAGALVQTGNRRPERIIDVHHHVMPPFYIREHRRDQLRVGPGITTIFEWTPQVSIERMDKAGVGTSILSISTPGTWFGQIEEGRRLMRAVNEYMARMVKDNPGRFGVFAALNLPDVDGSLKEIEYAFDTLKANGVGIMTSYSSLPVGWKEFDAVFAELNRRKAIVFMHRTVPSCCLELRGLPGDKEFIIDDMRALNSLLANGTLMRYPDIRLIHAHGDKTIPYMAGNGQGPNAALLKKIFVDTAGNTQDTMDDLRELGMLNTQVMFGTDNPYGGEDAVGTNLTRLMSFKLSQAELDAIGRNNATKLFPTLA